MITNLARWGNSLAVRIPSALVNEMQVREGISVDISVREGALMVRPVEDTHVYDLDTLIAGITEENRHGEIATGWPVGAEF